MEKVNNLRELQAKKQVWRKNGSTWGFVPTMGALHEGHASLIRAAASRHSEVVVSVFVNPTQFNDAKDFEAYPLTLAQDMEIATAAGATLLFAPTATEIYGGVIAAPPVDYDVLTSAFEAADRPGHFDGVVAVVDRLFAAVEPEVAYFGEKDLQQVAVVRRLAAERHPSIEVACEPLVRDADGLALSSRNVRLSAAGRAKALKLSEVLQSARAEALSGARGLADALTQGRAKLGAVAGLDLAYFEAVQTHNFLPIQHLTNTPSHLIIAGTIEGVRLIDNIALQERSEPVIVS